VSKFDPDKLRVDPTKQQTPIADESGLCRFVQPDGEIIMAQRVELPQYKPKRGRSKDAFIKMPWDWFEALDGADGQTYRLALYLQHLHWKSKGSPIKLTNTALAAIGVSRWAKYRALKDLALRGLIAVERAGQRSPTVRVIG
jgi:hypothetical protein